MPLIHLRPVFNQFGEPCWLLPTKADSAISKAVRESLLLSNIRWIDAARCWEVDHDSESELCDAVEAATKDADCWCPKCTEGIPCPVWGRMFAKATGLDYIDREPDDVEWPFDDEPAPSASSGRVPPIFSAAEVEEAAANAFRFFRDFFDRAMGGGMGGSGPVGSMPRPEMTTAEAMVVLTLTWPCTKEQLVTAFRREALKAHPDRGGSEAAIKKVVLARETMAQAMGVKL